MENELYEKAKKPLYSLFELKQLIKLHKRDTYYLDFKWGVDTHTGELLLFIIEILYGYPRVNAEIRAVNSLDLIHALNNIMVEFYSDLEDEDEDNQEGFPYQDLPLN